MPCLYVFGEPGMLLVKVGRAVRPKDRERDLKRDTPMPSGRFLYEKRMGWSHYDTAERLAHRYLKSRYWLQGEWFVCGADVARWAVKQAHRAARRKEARHKRETREWRMSPEHQRYRRERA